MSADRSLSARHRTFLVTFLTVLFAALVVQVATAQSDVQSGSPAIAEAVDASEVQAETELTSQNALPGLEAPSAVALAPVTLTDAPLTGAVTSQGAASMRLQTTSLRAALLQGTLDMEAEAASRNLRRGLVNREALAADASLAFPRQALLGLSKDGALVTGSAATAGRDEPPRLGLPMDGAPRDPVDPGTEGVVLMSVGF